MEVVAQVVTWLINLMALFVGIYFTMTAISHGIKAIEYHQTVGDEGCFWNEFNPFRNKAVFSVVMVLAAVFARAAVSKAIVALLTAAL